MRYIMIILLLVCASYSVMAQEKVHTLQVGDTFASLTETYDTCREAIIYENDLALNGIYSKYYFLEVGTELIIPPKVACDNLPVEGYHTVTEGETAYSILVKYRYPHGFVSIMTSDDTEIPILMDTDLNVGDTLKVGNLWHYLSTTQELWVFEDVAEFFQSVHVLQAHDSLDQLAEQYRTCREAIIWENQLVLPRQSSVGYRVDAGDTLIIPPATACDLLPTGLYTVTLDEPMTQRQLMTRYQLYPSTYYLANEPQVGLLPIGTEQNIMDIQSMFLAPYDLIVETESVEATIHTVAVGDTFTMLEAQYNTCAEAILYANEILQRTSSLNPTFIIKAGTQITIPPASQCDEIPSDPLVYTLKQGDTLWDIAYLYNTTIDAIIETSIHSDESPLSLLEPSDLEKLNYDKFGVEYVFVIPNQSGYFDLRHNDRLLVYTDYDRIEYVSASISLSEASQCYGVDELELMQLNGLDSVPFTGGSLIIPDPQHDCILQPVYGALGTHACYDRPLEQIVELPQHVTRLMAPLDNTGDRYCYPRHFVYEVLFENEHVILHDRTSGTDLGKSGEPWTLSMDMINYCFRHDKDALRDVTWETYDASIVPPDDDITVFALPEHITCNREMFNDYYVYRVRNLDRLTHIAKAYGTHPDLIAQANNLSNPNLIYVGQYLLIPTPTFPHLLQLAGGFIGLILAVIGLRRVLRRRTQKVKRKSKS